MFKSDLTGLLRKNLVFLFLALSLSGAQQLKADLCANRTSQLQNTSNWTPLGPSNGRINTVVVADDGSITIGSNSGGVFKSNDGGQSWVSMSAGLGSSNINY